MLPKSKRLKLKKDFKWVAAGYAIDTKYAKLFLRTGDNSFPRVGIATSSKAFKKATDRNRARRILSSALEPLYHKLPQQINIVALPKLAILGVKSGDVLVELEQVLRGHKILNEEISSSSN